MTYNFYRADSYYKDDNWSIDFDAFDEKNNDVAINITFKDGDVLFSINDELINDNDVKVQILKDLKDSEYQIEEDDDTFDKYWWKDFFYNISEDIPDIYEQAMETQEEMEK